MFPEPQVSFLILDYKKEIETRLLLMSLKRHVKFDHKIIYLHNGNSEEYPMQLMRDGWIDHFIVTKDNNGLGLGTRDLFAACFSRYAIYVQNDQILGRDFTQEELDVLIGKIEEGQSNIKSISLAGAPCGAGIYSERAHIITTEFYRELEFEYGLSYGGAGPHHAIDWREGQIQGFYKKYGWLHYPYEQPLFADNGVYAIRENKDGSAWCHRTDTKELWNFVRPTEVNSAYPKLNEEEWVLAINGSWPDKKIPANEIKDSFSCWQNSFLVEKETEYINRLKNKYKK